jgi:hypothetical protein
MYREPQCPLEKQELMEVFSNGHWVIQDQDQTLTELVQSVKDEKGISIFCL